MLNEGMVTGDNRRQVKTAMLRVLWEARRIEPREWEGRTFQALVGAKREDVDWDHEDNQAGYYLWLKAFDGLIEELRDDGYVKQVEVDGRSLLEAVERDQEIPWSEPGPA